MKKAEEEESGDVVSGTLSNATTVILRVILRAGEAIQSPWPLDSVTADSGFCFACAGNDEWIQFHDLASEFARGLH